jgi:hypothetical protein
MPWRYDSNELGRCPKRPMGNGVSKRLCNGLRRKYCRVCLGTVINCEVLLGKEIDIQRLALRKVGRRVTGDATRKVGDKRCELDVQRTT